MKDVSEIMHLIPHRPPMVWVDRVLEFNAEGGVCAVDIKADANYMSDQGLRPSSCLEFIAQSYGFTSICFREFSGDPVTETPKRAFLAAFNDASISDDVSRVRAGDSLRVKISGARALGPIILFTGEVYLGETKLCGARMKVFTE